MSLATIVFDFDPLVRLSGLTVRLETVGLAVAVLAALVWAALAAGRTDTAQIAGRGTVAGLRRDDLLFVVLGTLPGAVAGGRLGYLLLHLDYYAATPGAILDPGQGSLELTLAIVGGTLSGAVVAGMLDGSLGRWLAAATTPLLVGIALGKVAMALGGSGQGLPWSGSLATSYAGPGPWNSVDPATPAFPAQLVEALLTLAVALGVRRLAARLPATVGDGRVFLVALALWAGARFVVAFMWRDPGLIGPLRADQFLSLALLAGSLLLLPAAERAARRSAAAAANDERAALAWPDRPEGLRP